MAIPYRWVIVALGGLMGCVAIGAMFSLAVFLEPMAAETGLVARRHFVCDDDQLPGHGRRRLRLGGASDRWGARIVTLCGAVLLGPALVVASRATTLLGFQLAFGVLVGLAASAFFAPMIAAVTGWFDTRRTLAVSLVSAGMGMAPLTMSPFAGWLITHYGWRAAHVRDRGARLGAADSGGALRAPAARRAPRRAASRAAERPASASARRCARRSSWCSASPSCCAASRTPGRSSTW